MSGVSGATSPSMSIPPPEASLPPSIYQQEVDIRMMPMAHPAVGARPGRRKNPSASWSQTMDNELISLYHAARVDSPMKPQCNLARGHWNKIAAIISAHTGLSLKGQQARSRFGILKKKHALWNALVSRPGFSVVANKAEASPDDWSAAINDEILYSQFRGRPYAYESTMEAALRGEPGTTKTISELYGMLEPMPVQYRARAYPETSEYLSDIRLPEPNVSGQLHSELAKLYDVPGASKELQEEINRELEDACLKCMQVTDVEERRLAAALQSHTRAALKIACIDKILKTSTEHLRLYYKALDSEYSDPVLGKRTLAQHLLDSDAGGPEAKKQRTAEDRLARPSIV